jgi:hypothetical protein
MEIITFYDVPLVCGAAPAIGCGSRAKPLLMDLEQRTAIKEAWLNRAGTIVAVVWSGPARTEEVAKPVFERHEIQYRERGDDRKTTGSFRSEGAWLRGAEVDRLSLEEAREIAETSVASAAKDWSRLRKGHISNPTLKRISGKSSSSSELNKNCCKMRGASSRRRCSTSTRSMSERKELPRCRRTESRTRSTAQTGRRPHAVVHKSAEEPESCLLGSRPTKSDNSPLGQKPAIREPPKKSAYDEQN